MESVTFFCKKCKKYSKKEVRSILKWKNICLECNPKESLLIAKDVKKLKEIQNTPEKLENEKIRHSGAYRTWRQLVLERDGYACVLCGRKKSLICKLHVDHIKSFIKNPNLRLNLENGRTLCIECHKKTETYGKKSFFSTKMKENTLKPTIMWF
jgi:5-methylcytosine-specific restriction endonuclease McrA